MAELTPESQAARRTAQTAKRCRKRLRTTERNAAETKLETANLSSFTALKVHLYLSPARDANPEGQKGRPKRLTGVKTLFPRTNRMVCTPVRSKERESPD